MRNEPKIMKDIHDIRVNHYSEEVGLSAQELSRKRHREMQEVDGIIAEYGLKVFRDSGLDRYAV
jgi:hypothetical protein